MKRCLLVLLTSLITLSLAQEYPYTHDAKVPFGNTHRKIDLMKSRVSSAERTVSVRIHQIWLCLERMTLKEKQNAEIGIDLALNANPEAINLARQIENLWNNGKFQEALTLFSDLIKQTNSNDIEIGIAWRTPVPTTASSTDWAEDIRIGNRDSIYLVSLDIHRATGNLFVVLVNFDSLDYWWSVNFSTDGGVTWSETYTIRSGINYSYNTISASVLANHCYVAYDLGDQARLRRFKVLDGTRENFNNGDQFINVFTTTSPDSVKEVFVTSNQDYSNNRLYYNAITKQGNLRFFWDDTGAVSWSEVTTNVTNAERGLDVTCDEGFANYPVWTSYISYSDSLYIGAVNISAIWSKLFSYLVGSHARFTSIGAYHDTIICVFEYHGTLTDHCRYWTSYNGGATWLWGNVGSDTIISSESPDVAARAGGGEAIVYRYYMPNRELRTTWRDYYGNWSTPINLADHEPYNNKPSTEYLGDGKYGVVYLNWGAGISSTWSNGPQTGFRFTRFDGEYFPKTKKVYFLGGRLSDASTDGSVWSFVPDSGIYRNMGVTMPLPVSNYNICLLQDNYSSTDTFGLYIVGGRLGTNAKTTVVQVYYPVSNTVRVINTDSLPMRINGRIPIPGANVAVNNKMYVFGGFNDSVSPYVSDQTWVYDPLASAGSRWSQITTANLSLARCYISNAVVDGKIYAIGGDSYDGSSLRAQKRCERFDPANPAAGWQILADLPDSSDETRAFGFDVASPYQFTNKIIVAGNGKWSNETNQCFIYDIAANSWATFTNLLQARRNHAGVLIPGAEWSFGMPGIWVFGGRAVNDTNVLRSSEYYSIAPRIYLGAFFDRSDRQTGIVEPALLTAVIPAMSLVPNPSRGFAKLSYSVRREGHVKISLYDATGRLVNRLFDENKAPGEYSININKKTLTAGIYFIHLKTPDGTTRKTMTIIK